MNYTIKINKTANIDIISAVIGVEKFNKVYHMLLHGGKGMHDALGEFGYRLEFDNSMSRNSVVIEVSKESITDRVEELFNEVYISKAAGKIPYILISKKWLDQLSDESGRSFGTSGWITMYKGVEVLTTNRDNVLKVVTEVQETK